MLKNSSKLKIATVVLSFTLSLSAFAQKQNSISRSQLLGQRNVITTAVPFLTITPDSRRAGMGDAGVASSPDANSIFWNTASLAFSEQKVGMSISYAPWLRALVPGISYNHLAGYAKVGERSVIGGSLRYFALGKINFTDDVGNPLGDFNPNEFAVDMAFANQISENWGLGVNLKYIYSNLAGTRPLNGITPKPGQAGAGDVSAFYKNKIEKGSKDKRKVYNYTFGVNIQNLGSRITYTDKTNREYIPANLKLGTSWSYKIDQFNTITGMIDFNKLLVPSLGIKVFKGTDGNDSLDVDGNVVYEKTKTEDPTITAALKSFYDAPGGFREELREFNPSIGLEYNYVNQFFIRGGFFYEHLTKGNRKYFTVGFGIKAKVLNIDAAYLAPIIQRHPLQNQLRFSLLFNLEEIRKATKGSGSAS